MNESLLPNKHHEFSVNFIQNKVSSELSSLLNPSDECYLCFEKKVSSRKYARGQIIISELEKGYGVFYILSGLVKLTKQDEHGNELIVSIKTKGDIFAESCLFNKREYPYTNTAMMIQEGEILFLDTNFFEAELKTCPLLTEKIIRNLSEQIEEFSSRLFEMAHLDIYSQILSTLEKLTKKFGKRLDDTIYIDIPITMQDLSLLVGASRESTSRAFSKLKKTHLIEFKHKRIIFLDGSKFKGFMKF